MSPFLPTLVTSARSTTRISRPRGPPSEGLLVAVEPAGGGRPGGRVGGLAALVAALVAAPGVGLLAVGRRSAAGLAAAAPVGLFGAGDRPPHARPDLVGDHLDLRALLAVLGLPRALLEAARDDHPVAF